MSICEGKCLIQCKCNCYNEEGYYEDICTCGHREHYGYCLYRECVCECLEEECLCGHRDHNGLCHYYPQFCCKPIKCINFENCKKQFSELNKRKNGFCRNCNIRMGNFELTTLIDQCDICNEDEKIILLKCNHKIGLNCWYKINKSIKASASRCPFCRNNNH